MKTPNINALLRARMRPCQYGAPMGARNYDDAPEGSKKYCQRVRFVDGDYAPDGTYWGGGRGVLPLLRQRLDNLNEISEALKKVVEKHRDRQAAFRNVALGYVSAERALIGEHTSNFRKDLAELWAKVETEINPKLSEPLTKADVYAHYLEDEA